MTTRLASHKHKKVRKALWRVEPAVPNEVLIFCPGCKALEVVRFTGEGMIPTRRFTQEMDKVYHACGSGVPCRLHTLSGHRESAGGAVAGRLASPPVAARRDGASHLVQA